MASSKTLVGVVVAVVIIVVVAAIAMQMMGGQPQQAPAPAQTPTESPAQTPTTPAKVTIKIAGILPLTGDLASYGKRAKVAMEMAIRDFEEEYGVDVEYVVEDTATDPNIAFEKLQSLFARGYRFIVGPMTSAEVRQLSKYADQNGILMVSPSSTAPELAVDDNTLRFVPTDVFQSKAVAAYIAQQGIKCVVLSWRGDAWGDGLAKATKEELTKLGVQVVAEVRYDPKAPEFGQYVSSIASGVRQCIESVGSEASAVELIAFGEAKDILNLAADYPELMEVKWYGSDGTAQLTEVVEQACEPASRVGLDSPVFAPAETQLKQEFVSRFMDEAGEEPDAYSIINYDVTYVLLLAIKKAYDEGMEPTADVVKRNILDVLRTYNGVSGKIELDAAGDRASGNYNFFKVVKTDGECAWKRVAFWDSTTGEVQELAS